MAFDASNRLVSVRINSEAKDFFSQCVCASDSIKNTLQTNLLLVKIDQRVVTAMLYHYMWYNFFITSLTVAIHFNSQIE